jgi:D-glycero-alpha-D-manno-heptose 1-phosphate guanylyltransferase
MKHAVLLAGGRGSRLDSVSEGLPKPLMQVAGRPFIEYVLENLVSAGCDHIVVAASYKWELLRDHLGDRYKSCALDWSIESRPLGTGGAIRQAFRVFNLTDALVLNADTLFRIDFDALEARHAESSAAVTVALREVPDVARYGEVLVDGNQRIVEFREKGRHGRGLINGGIYLIDECIWTDALPVDAFSFEVDVLQRRVGCESLYGYRADRYFIDIGIPEDLERARNDLRDNRC